MFPMQVTIQNVTQLNAVMAALMTPAEHNEPAKKEVKVDVKKPTAATPAVTAPTAEPTAAAPEQKAESSAPVASAAPTYADAAAAITKLSKVKGRDAAVAVLASFGAQKLPDVAPEQFAAVIAAAEKAGA